MHLRDTEPKINIVAGTWPVPDQLRNRIVLFEVPDLIPDDSVGGCPSVAVT